MVGWFKVNHVTQADYWLEVWIRGGRKDLGEYNGPRIAA